MSRSGGHDDMMPGVLRLPVRERLDSLRLASGERDGGVRLRSTTSQRGWCLAVMAMRRIGGFLLAMVISTGGMAAACGSSSNGRFAFQRGVTVASRSQFGLPA